MMNKIRVGILPTAKLFEDENPYNDTYSFINNYCKRISDMEAIPVGILLNDGMLDIESLDMCDAFLIAGGSKIDNYLLQSINYAVVNNKPLLGVCLGMQAIGIYSLIIDRLTKSGALVTDESILSMFKTLKEEKVQFLDPVDEHYKNVIGRNNYQDNMHIIEINPKSELYQIYKTKEIDVLSMHNYALAKYGENIIISAKSNDIIEAIEYMGKDLFIIGVQFHAEIEDSNAVLFERLIKEAKKRIKTN